MRKKTKRCFEKSLVMCTNASRQKFKCVLIYCLGMKMSSKLTRPSECPNFLRKILYKMLLLSSQRVNFQNKSQLMDGLSGRIPAVIKKTFFLPIRQ